MDVIKKLDIIFMFYNENYKFKFINFKIFIYEKKSNYKMYKFLWKIND